MKMAEFLPLKVIPSSFKTAKEDNSVVFHSSHLYMNACIVLLNRVATVREKCLENEIFSRSGKSQGILLLAREI